MNNEIISKLARYVAFLRRESNIWRQGAMNIDRLNYLDGKMDGVMDICTMLGCRDEVWSEAAKIYDVTEES